METVFEDNLRARINAIRDRTGLDPDYVCLSEQEFEILKREIERNHKMVDRETPKNKDGKELPMVSYYEGVEIKVL